jgi:hypothetical protein
VTNKNKRSHGKSLSGVELTRDVIERMADEAEGGLDVSKLRRRPGRRSMGSGPAEGLPLRFEPELREAIENGPKPTVSLLGKSYAELPLQGLRHQRAAIMSA